MDNPTKKVKVNATGAIIEVYLTKRGTYCDFADCKTEYEKSQLTFL